VLLLVAAGRRILWWVNVHGWKICFQVTIKMVVFFDSFAGWMRTLDDLRPGSGEFTVIGTFL
jgi:hypothetical protein